MNYIPFMRPNVVKKESYLPYLDEIDQSRIYSNNGPLNTLLENRIEREMFKGKGRVTTVNNATTGLMLGIMDSKRSRGIYAIMPSFTFSATPLAAQWCGLIPYFVDVDPLTWSMDQKMVKDIVDKLGDEIAVIVPYATFGNNIDLDFYKELHEMGYPVVVDAAASFGSTDEKGQFGTGFPGLVVFSFHATKVFAVGEAGLIYSSNPETIQRIKQAANFGYYGNRESKILGLNGKLSEFTAAVALATLNKINETIKTRSVLDEWYNNYLNENSLFDIGWFGQKLRGHVVQQFKALLCPVEEFNVTYIEQLKTQQVQAVSYFSPACHQQEVFKNHPCLSMEITNSLTRRVICLPMWEEMTEEDVYRVVKGLYKEEII